MKRPRRAKRLRQMADRTLLLRDRRPPPEPATQPIRRYPDPGMYQAAPAGPTRLPPQTDDEPTIRTRRAAYGEWTGTMTVNDAPASAADHMDDRCRAAHLSLNLDAADLKTQGMLYRVDDAEEARKRGEELDERSVIALIVAKAVRHLMGPREPWEPAGWDHGVGGQPPAAPGPVVDVAWPGDPSGWRAAYQRELGGDAA